MSAQPQTPPDNWEVEEYDIEQDLPWLAEVKRRINEDIKDLSPEEVAAYFRERAALRRANDGAVGTISTHSEKRSEK